MIETNVRVMKGVLNVTAWECGICRFTLSSFQGIINHLKMVHNRVAKFEDGIMTIQDGEVNER